MSNSWKKLRHASLLVGPLSSHCARGRPGPNAQLIVQTPNPLRRRRCLPLPIPSLPRNGTEHARASIPSPRRSGAHATGHRPSRLAPVLAVLPLLCSRGPPRSGDPPRHSPTSPLAGKESLSRFLARVVRRASEFRCARYIGQDIFSAATTPSPSDWIRLSPAAAGMDAPIHPPIQPAAE